ncbi:tyrosine-type recombinase/integrase [Actinomadura sp. 6N118]|uniref:tyrosine-type recombinase/integrase n=1 Tax=Actinomadura sp. 6N118 TaxID=3375151 RepID=UPI003789969B
MEKETPPPEISAALEWIERKSLPLAELVDTEVLESALKGIAINLDGSKAAANSTKRRDGVFWTCMDWATKKKKVFEANPLNEVDWKPPETVVEVAPRQVPNPDQARALLAAVLVVAPQVGRHLYAFFACMYFAGLRPSEVVDLAEEDCDLPRSGWGLLRLAGSSPAAGKNWTDDGRYHEQRGLKSRAEGTQRPVPACPELVTILRAHIEEFGAGDGGLLFRSQRGNRLAPVSYESVWRRARAHALTPAQLATPLAERPYDLRHACLSLWLRSGVSEIEVAARAGHSVAMLQSTYAHCIDGDRDLMNKRIEAGLGSPGQGLTEHTEQAGAWSPDRRGSVPRLFRERRITVTYSGGQRSTPRGGTGGFVPGGDGFGQVDRPDLDEDVRRLHSAG